MITVNDYCRQIFGEKIYKIALSARVTCPTRDGKLGNRGCIFCSAAGSGDFAASPVLPIDEQIENAKAKVKGKYKGDKFIAYFQAFTSTYAPEPYLRQLFYSVINRDDICGLSIATRPDCIEPSVYDLLGELNKIKPVWVELGLQTIHPKTAAYIRRGYDLPVYEEAVHKLLSLGIHTITHIIIGLPGESTKDMTESVKYAVSLLNDGSGEIKGGLKLSLLHVLKGTDLADDYEAGLFEALTMEQYLDILKSCLKEIPENVVVHRLTGDGPKALLIAPLWTADKKRVLNSIKQLISDNK